MQPLGARVQQPRRKPQTPEAGGGPGRRGGGRREARCPLTARNACGLAVGSQLRAGPGQTPALSQPRPPASPLSLMETDTLGALSPGPAGGPGASVVGEWVPQEDEDQDDAGGGQGGAGDVEQPRRLGVFHGAVQVIQELLVPNLQPQDGVSGAAGTAATGAGRSAGRTPGGSSEPARPASGPRGGLGARGSGLRVPNSSPSKRL